MAITTTNARLQMRRGNYADMEPTKLQPGEWAVSLDRQYVHMCMGQGIVVRMATYEAFERDMERVEEIMAHAEDVDSAIREISETVNTEYADIQVIYPKVVEAETNAKNSEDNAKESEINAKISEINAKASEEHAVEVTTGIDEALEIARGYADITTTNASTCLTAEVNAKESETNAKSSEDLAKEYMEQAKAVAHIDIANYETPGIVKPDGSTIEIDSNGVIKTVFDGLYFPSKEAFYNYDKEKLTSSTVLFIRE